VKVYEAIAAALAKFDTNTMFGVMGDANLFLVDSFVRQYGGQFVSATHEASALMMAKGYADTSARLGVATVTHGPGLTNTVTALVEAVRGHTPLLLIAGDTSATDRLNIQRINQRDVVLSTGAAFEDTHSPDDILRALRRAVSRAVSELRPVVVNVPADLQWLDISESESSIHAAHFQAHFQQTRPDPEAIDRALGVALAGKRPILLAGNGVNSIRGRDVLLKLGAALGAPVATTLKAKDLFRGEQFNLGIFGTLSTEAASEVIGAADCVLAFGASLNRWTTSGGSLLQGKRVVQFDVNPARLGMYARINEGVVGDAAAAAETLTDWLAQAGMSPSRFRSPDLARRLSATPAGAPGKSAGSRLLTDVLSAIDKAVPADRTVVADLGRTIFEAITQIEITHPRGLVWSANFGSIGLGVPAAIGAHFGAVGNPVVLVSGDGGFMMGGVAEFSTAVRHAVDLIIVVCNDGAYGAEHIQFRNRDMDPSLSLMAWPELSELAIALGGRGYAVRGPEDLGALDALIRDRSGPILIDVKLDVDGVANLGH
jgi:thiamine pyrophosphate-dependent acetolactate synthase large subunit-like protein